MEMQVNPNFIRVGEIDRKVFEDYLVETKRHNIIINGILRALDSLEEKNIEDFFIKDVFVQAKSFAVKDYNCRMSLWSAWRIQNNFATLEQIEGRQPCDFVISDVDKSALPIYRL